VVIAPILDILVGKKASKRYSSLMKRRHRMEIGDSGVPSSNPYKPTTIVALSFFQAMAVHTLAT
jgi:hypothetical protein